MSPLSFCILVMSLLFFFFNQAKGLSVLLVFLKKPTFGFISLLYCFSSLYFISLCSNLYYFLSTVTLGLVCSFSSSLRCKKTVVDLKSFFFFLIFILSF